MKKNTLVLLSSLYIAVLFGLVLHTSRSPQIFNKYSIKYSFVLLALLIGFPIFLWLINYIFKTSKFRLKKNKITLNPKKKILIFFVAIIILILSAEMFLRNEYKNYESNTYRYTIDNFHPFLQSQIAKHEGLTVNSLGFRGEEISVEKPINTFRIVVLGGSSVLNREVLFEENAARVLEKKLRKEFPDKKIEVINAGKDFYTTEHSLIQYMFKISDLNPDLVIMWHGVNDMTLSCLIEGKSTHGSYRSDYSHNFGAVSKIVFDYFKPAPIIKIKLLTFDFVKKALQDNLYSDILNPLLVKNKDQEAKDFMENKNTVFVKDFPSIASYERNVKYLINFLEKNSTPLILGNQPSLYKSSNSNEEVKAIMFPALVCRKDGKFYSLDSFKYGLNLFNQKTEKIAEDNNVMFINLDKLVPKDLNNFTDSVHYTKEGNEKIAEGLFNYILSKELIAP